MNNTEEKQRKRKPYTAEQAAVILHEQKKGMSEDLLSVFADPEYSMFQMIALADALRNGADPDCLWKYVYPTWSPDQIQSFGEALRDLPTHSFLMFGITGPNLALHKVQRVMKIWEMQVIEGKINPKPNERIFIGPKEYEKIVIFQENLENIAEKYPDRSSLASTSRAKIHSRMAHRYKRSSEEYEEEKTENREERRWRERKRRRKGRIIH